MSVGLDYVRTAWHHRVAAGAYEIGGDLFSFSLVPQFVLRHRWAAGQLVLFWEGAGILQASPEAQPGFTDIGAVSPYIVTNLTGAGMRYRLMRQQ